MKLWAAVVLAPLTIAACSDAPPGRTYYERNIQPILLQTCAGNTSGCHSANPEDPFSFAAGNFDVTTFENVQKRRDLLQPFGPFSHSLLLIKSVPPGTLSVAYGTGFRPIEVLHAGGPIFEVGSPAYLTLQQWVDNGATLNGLAPPSPARDSEGDCATSVPSGFSAATYLANPTFQEFRSQVQPLLRTCAGAACHGAPQSDFYVTCGDDDTQLAFNFAQAWAFVAEPVDDSQLLRVPLAVKAGGLPHSGGDQLASRSDPKYLALRAWAEKVRRVDFGGIDPGRRFFADHVQPLLLQRGCSFEACHSPSSTNDFKLRTGTQGFFSAVALERNYGLLRDEFMALEMADIRRGRAVAKSILSGSGGIAHRGGAVLETPGKGLSSTPCPPFVPATATAFCIVQEWARIERQALLAAGEVTPMEQGNTAKIVYVDRPATHLAGRLEFDTYQPGADLRVATATFGVGQAIDTVGASSSLLGNCAGAVVASADVQAPSVHRDGKTVAFAMRTSAADPLGIWTVDLDTLACSRVTPAAPDQAGQKIHNFDPAWSPDGNSIVFASTRGKPGVGPTRTRKLFLPQSDLWRMRGDGSGVEQVTFLTNSEVRPAFMREGRITMTTEKISGDFYQLSGRRLNWDRTDYHPLLAQRAESIYADPTSLDQRRPSVGFSQATDIREDANGNFAIILSDAGVRGAAGTLAIFNRSIGPVERGRSDEGYLVSMHIVDPAATGRAGPTSGAYRAPFGMPDGTIMASYTGFAGDLRNPGALNWDIVAVHPRTGARQTLISGPGAQVDAVLALKHPARKMYENRRQLVFGGTVNPALGQRASVYMPDAPMVFTLLNANLRRGRPVGAFAKATQLAIYRENPAPAGTSSGGGPGGIFQSRDLLGRAGLAKDGSVRVEAPAGAGVILELQDSSGNPLITMGEEHQLGPGEVISLGIRRELFNAVCGGCHGSVSGNELDVVVTPDALTGASESLSKTSSPVQIAP
ncbi:MAG: PD40 domain-containing protein [Myxococcales bacterium]|nr:PD40 domain-containing protein [Myxococcales bacterium]